MFGDRLLAGLADPGNRLCAGAECPLRTAAGSGIGWLCAPQGMRVLAVRLRFKLRCVATAASGASDVAWTGILPGDGRHPNDCQQRQKPKRNHGPKPRMNTD